MGRRISKDKVIGGYRVKRERRRKYTILIALEGKNATERLYFKSFNHPSNPFIIKIARGNTTDPVNMVWNLIDEIDRLGISTSRGDFAYCIFDTDEKPYKDIQIKEAIQLASNHNIEIILSSPCFEEWILCHFDKSTKELSNKEAFKHVQKYIPHYDKNYNVYFDIVDKTDVGIQNAKYKEEYLRGQGKNLNSVHANPSTQVYKIVERIRRSSIR